MVLTERNLPRSRLIWLTTSGHEELHEEEVNADEENVDEEE